MNRRNFILAALFAAVAGVTRLPGRVLAGSGYPAVSHPAKTLTELEATAKASGESVETVAGSLDVFEKKLKAASLHPAIRANIDYWMKACPEWLAECPPFHTSLYAVKEDGALRVYAVKWNGSNLNDHTLSVPANERTLASDLQREIDRDNQLFKRGAAPGEGLDIGEHFETTNGKVWGYCSYVRDSPLRRNKEWDGSIATALLEQNRFFKLTSKDDFSLTRL